MSFNCPRILTQCQILRLNQVYHKKHEKLPTNTPIYIYINRINNRLKLWVTRWIWWIWVRTTSVKKNNRQNKERKKCPESWSGWISFSPM